MVTYLHMVAGVPAEWKGRGPGRAVDGGKSAAAFIAALSGLIHLSMIVDEADHGRDRRSSSAIAKYALALRRISSA